MSKKSPHPAISIVIPAFNEAGTIKKVLEDLHHYVAKNLEAEIIVVNDGSKDKTGDIVSNLPYLKLINHSQNRGYSASLKTGIKEAKHDWILTFDADGSHACEEIDKLLPYMANFDMVVGSRANGEAYDTVMRKTGRRIVTRFARYLSGVQIPDINSGFRLFKKDLALKFWHLYPEGFSFSTTITVASHVKHFAVKYVPIKVLERKAGTSTIKPIKDFTGFMSLVTRLAIYFRPLKVFIPIAMFFFLVAFILVIIDFVTGQFLNTTFAVFVTLATQLVFFGLLTDMIVKRFYED